MSLMVTAIAAGITVFAGQTKPAGPVPLTVLRIAAGPQGEVRNNDFVLAAGLQRIRRAGGSRRRIARLGHVGSVRPFRFRAELRGVPVVPISLVRASLDTTPTPLADARARGDLIPAVQGRQHVLSAGFARGITRTETVTPADQRQEFSIRDKEIVVFLTWSPQKRVRGALVLRQQKRYV